MTLELATVLRLDRDVGECDVLRAGQVERYPWVGSAPPPLSSVPVLDRRVVYSIPNGGRRIILHDDFAHVGLLPASIIARLGDTGWRHTSTGGGGSVVATPGGTGRAQVSVVVNVSNPSTSVLHKELNTTPLPDPESALWMSCDMDPGTVGPGGSGVLTGFFDTVTLASNGVFVGPPIIAQGGFVGVTTSGVQTTVLTGDIDTSDRYILDLVVTSEWVAAWCNGNGPAVIDAGIPTVNLGLAFAVFTPASGASAQSNIDWMHLESFAPSIHPSAIAEALPT